MAKKKKPQPRLLVADEQGNIYDHPDLLMLVRRGEEFGLPRPDELRALPPESELFMLPGRHAVGLDPEGGSNGGIEVLDENAVSAFVTPGYTLAGLAAYVTAEGAPTLPMFAYGAVGFANDTFYVAAARVDTDTRQVFQGIPKKRIQQGARELLNRYPDNRLIRHLGDCALVNCCPAARNFALGRYECPLPTSRTCNARCVGCISEQPPESPFPATQCRIKFTPTPEEICQVMQVHGAREQRPIFSFGQGCEGEPLTEAETIAQGIRLFRQSGGAGTVNVNTNGSLPHTMQPLAQAGVNAIRVSLNSARPEVYESYYRPRGYGFADVVQTIAQAKASGLFVSLNLLYFPGVTDTEEELAALVDLISAHKVDLVQLRNLNLDPELYMRLLSGHTISASMGLGNFRKRLKLECPWLQFGYFNPYLG